MNYVEFFTSNTYRSAEEATILLSNIYVMSMNWEEIDDFALTRKQVYERMQLFIVQGISKGVIKGDIIGKNNTGNFPRTVEELNFERTKIKPSSLEDWVRKSGIKEIKEYLPEEKNAPGPVDRTIEAAVMATVYCMSNHEDITITNKMLSDQLRYEGFTDVPTTTVEDIYKAIPEYIRHSKKGGQPKKTLDEAINVSFKTGIKFNEHKSDDYKKFQQSIFDIHGKKLRDDILSKIYKCFQEQQAAEK